MGCAFLKSLSTLRKHSAESVDFADVISDQSKYLHVHRTIEDDLIALLEQAKQSTAKSLVFLCGSAGDGKSHMLSFLKNGEHSNLLDGFVIRNDATESYAPDKTAPETLAKALAAFDDDHVGDGGSERMIVAINLGLLSRFLESDSGQSFTQLSNYVDNLGLLKTGLSNTGVSQQGPFWSIDFSDYQFFTIQNGVAQTDFVDTLLEKVFAQVADNPFFSAKEKACANCGIDTALCPVKHNFEFLTNDCVRKNISEMLVEIALREKCVITARAILDFVYEALVSPEFDIERLVKRSAESPRDYAPEFLSMTTPQLLFASGDSTGLISKFSMLDPMNDDTGWVDEVAATFRASVDNIHGLFKGIENASYKEVLDSCAGFSVNAIANSESTSLDIKEAILCFSIRGAFLMDSCDKIREGLVKSTWVAEFIQLIYDFNKGNDKELSYLKKQLITKAIEDWNGDYPNKYSLVETYGDIQLLQKLSLSFGSYPISAIESEMLSRFRPEVWINVTNKDKAYDDFVAFQIDFNVFELLKKMESGYQPTLMDKTSFSGFESSYRRLLSQGTKGTNVYVVRRSKGKQPFLELQLDDNLEFSSEVI